MFVANAFTYGLVNLSGLCMCQGEIFHCYGGSIHEADSTAPNDRMFLRMIAEKVYL
jgi:hypothetical protein